MPKEIKRHSSIEYRTFPLAEVRADASEGKPRIVGHAAVFNALSEEMFGFREQIAPGAFKKTLQEADVRALFNHDPNIVLGRNKSGTLGLAEDETGLAIDATPPDTQTVRDLVLEPMRRGDINQMSFGFRTIRDQWEEDHANKTLTRTLLEVRLFDVSVVTYPAYPQTDAAVRSQVLDEHGIDIFAIRSAMAKVDHNLAVSDEEMAQLRQALETLTRYTAAPGQAAHPAVVATQPPIDMETLRRRVARASAICRIQ